MVPTLLVVAISVVLILFSTTTLGLHFHSKSGRKNAVPHILLSSSPSSLLVPAHVSTRRQLIFAGVGGVTTATGICLPPRQANAVASPFEQPSLRQPYARVQGIGDGFDLLGVSKQMAEIDILYPPSLNGTWVCTRKIIAVEGDTNQAEGAWKLLGGTIISSGGGRSGGFKNAEENYLIRFVDLRRPTDGIIGLDGKKYYGVILDRGYEIEERTGSKNIDGGGDGDGDKTIVNWDPRVAPNILQYERPGKNNGIATELKVVQRTVEPQNNQGSLVGSNELIRITTTKTLGNTKFEVMYATRLQRRFRRTTTEEGDRVVEGIEIQKTYRVLDGIVNIHTPTSTTKSTLRLTRTYPTRPATSSVTTSTSIAPATTTEIIPTTTTADDINVDDTTTAAL